MFGCAIVTLTTASMTAIRSLAWADRSALPLPLPLAPAAAAVVPEDAGRCITLIATHLQAKLRNKSKNSNKHRSARVVLLPP
jgi:hypothetical protein